jgi:hypothetical protein
MSYWLATCCAVWQHVLRWRQVTGYGEDDADKSSADDDNSDSGSDKDRSLDVGRVRACPRVSVRARVRVCALRALVHARLRTARARVLTEYLPSALADAVPHCVAQRMERCGPPQ